MESEIPPPAVRRIVLRPAVEKFLRKLRDPVLGRRLEAAIQALAHEPRPAGAVLLENREQIWRIRVGDYRILYQLDDGMHTVRIAAIGHRRDIYRN